MQLYSLQGCLRLLVPALAVFDFQNNQAGLNENLNFYMLTTNKRGQHLDYTFFLLFIENKTRHFIQNVEPYFL